MLGAFAGFYLKNGFLWLAGCCVEQMPAGTAGKRFLSGAIRLKQGDAAQGLGMMRAGVEENPALAGEMDRILDEVEKEWLSAPGPATFRTVMRKRLILLGPSRRVLETLWPKEFSHLERILSKSPVSPERMAEIDAVLSDWEPVRERLPGWWIIRARWFSIQGLAGDALAAVETALSMGDDPPADWLALSARLLIEAGRPDEGLSRLGEAVDLNAGTAVLWEEIGDALADGSDNDGALAAYEKCLAALPDRWGVLKKMGDCYAAKGQMEAAKAAYEAVKDGVRRTADG
jgi:tetratricopeptide (TPR) repeat protein